MPDTQQYQYYDPSPPPPPQPWWKRKRTWQVIGMTCFALLILAFTATAAYNTIKNRSSVGAGKSMDQVEALVNQLSAECDDGDAACLERAQADAARAAGVVRACDELSGAARGSCVTLIARDQKNPDLCRVLSGDEQGKCLDAALLLKAQGDFDLGLCDDISVASHRASCRAQIEAKAIATNACAEVGIEVSRCETVAALNAATALGTPEACAALVDEQDQLDCVAGIESVDDDQDNLVLKDEVSRGLSDAVADTDGDGLLDGDEVHVQGTDPAKADTDGDGFSDGTEVAGGYDPLK